MLIIHPASVYLTIEIFDCRLQTLLVDVRIQAERLAHRQDTMEMGYRPRQVVKNAYVDQYIGLELYLFHIVEHHINVADIQEIQPQQSLGDVIRPNVDGCDVLESPSEWDRVPTVPTAKLNGCKLLTRQIVQNVSQPEIRLRKLDVPAEHRQQLLSDQSLPGCSQ
jgi:hypothetical protein